MTPKAFSRIVEAYLSALPHAASMTRETATEEVRQLVFLIEARRRGGGLTEINQAYRAARLAGQTRQPFSEFYVECVRDMVVAEAKAQPARS